MSDLVNTILSTASEQKSRSNQRKATVVRVCGEEHSAVTPPADDPARPPQSATIYFCTDPEMAYLSQWRFKLIIGDPLGDDHDANINWGSQPNYGSLGATHGPWSSLSEFYNDTYGKGVDMDGSYGYQCWDLIEYFMVNQAGVRFATGVSVGLGACYSGVYWSWANTAARNKITETGKFRAISGNSDIMPGDVVICDLGTVMGGECGNIKVGHVGIALDGIDSGIYRHQNKINLLAQNQGGYPYRLGGANANVIQLPISKILGVFRYTGSDYMPNPPAGYNVP
nr:MAG TPA: transcriptional regulator [Caudoviricetes sp.]